MQQQTLMENTEKTELLNDTESSAMFAMSLDALNLINAGNDVEAHQKFPLEYHIIKKYNTVSISELFQLLNRKLSV